MSRGQTLVTLLVVGATMGGVAPALAGPATKRTAKMVAWPASCDASTNTCRNGKAGSCSTDADCQAGTITSGTTGDTGALTWTIKVAGIRDANGNLVNSDPADNATDYVFKTSLSTLLQNMPYAQNFYLLIPVHNGVAKFTFEWATLSLFGVGGWLPTGGPFTLSGGALYAPPPPGLCPNLDPTAPTDPNSSNLVFRRMNVDACETGGLIAANAAITATLVTRMPTCFQNVCTNSANACTQNVFPSAECNLGSLSWKSKATLSKTLTFVASLTGVVDPLGAPVTTNPSDPESQYVCAIKGTMLAGGIPTDATAYFRVNLTNGRGRVAANLKQFPEFQTLLSGKGYVFASEGVKIFLPPAPGTCPGDNSLPAVQARMNNSACEAGGLLGVAGVAKEF